MIQCIEDKANLMNDSAVCEKVNHLCQMAENGLGIASMTVPSIFRLDMSNIEALQLVCGSLGSRLDSADEVSAELCADGTKRSAGRGNCQKKHHD